MTLQAKTERQQAECWTTIWLSVSPPVPSTLRSSKFSMPTFSVCPVRFAVENNVRGIITFSVTHSHSLSFSVCHLDTDIINVSNRAGLPDWSVYSTLIEVWNQIGTFPKLTLKHKTNKEHIFNKRNPNYTYYITFCHFEKTEQPTLAKLESISKSKDTGIGVNF